MSSSFPSPPPSGGGGSSSSSMMSICSSSPSLPAPPPLSSLLGKGETTSTTTIAGGTGSGMLPAAVVSSSSSSREPLTIVHHPRPPAAAAAAAAAAAVAAVGFPTNISSTNCSSTLTSSSSPSFSPNSLPGGGLITLTSTPCSILPSSTSTPFPPPPPPPLPIAALLTGHTPTPPPGGLLTATCGGTSLQLPNETLYVSNINDKIKRSDLVPLLHEFFIPYGMVLRIVVKAPGKLHKNTTTPAVTTTTSYQPRLRGQAFVVFNDIAGSSAAMRCLQGKRFLGKLIKIHFAKQKSDITLKKHPKYKITSIAKFD